MTIKLTISYDGSKFYGSQIQAKKDTVHGRINLALKTLGINSKIAFSGRTDKDVHATMQVLSFTLPSYWTDLEKLKQSLISFMPNSIVIKSLKQVQDSFHARFSAKKRSYRYIISKKPLNAFNCSYMTYYEHINSYLINKAIKEFVGIHDFNYFHKKGSEPFCTIREIYDIKFYEYKNIYVFKFTANSYLRSQIRMMIYAIMQVSNNNISIDDLKKQINNQIQISKKLAPASGLYLSRIYY